MSARSSFLLGGRALMQGCAHLQGAQKACEGLTASPCISPAPARTRVDPSKSRSGVHLGGPAASCVPGSLGSRTS